jgi:hypothetical protein
MAKAAMVSGVISKSSWLALIGRTSRRWHHSIGVHESVLPTAPAVACDPGRQFFVRFVLAY